jgi:hypothetical protein
LSWTSPRRTIFASWSVRVSSTSTLDQIEIVPILAPLFRSVEHADGPPDGFLGRIAPELSEPAFQTTMIPSRSVATMLSPEDSTIAARKA